MIRPQMRQQKELQSLLSSLKKGDEVVTQGGIIGRVTKCGEQYLTVEIANGVEINVQRGAVAADRRRADYVLIGTLASFGWALAVAVAILALATRLQP